MRGVEHHQPRELAGRAGGDDLSTKAALAQERKPAAMVQMSVRQQDIVDRRGIEPKAVSVLLRELTAALKQPAIDKDSLACAFHQMARSSHVAIRTVKFQFQHIPPSLTERHPLMCATRSSDRAACRTPRASPEFPSRHHARFRQTKI